MGKRVIISPLALAFALSLLIALLRFLAGNPRGEHG